jgi:hypothetical protein
MSGEPYVLDSAATLCFLLAAVITSGLVPQSNILKGRVAMRNLLTALLIAFAAVPAAAQLPAPGSTYHLLFATSGIFHTIGSQLVPPGPSSFGNIPSADWQVTNSAFNGYLPGASGWNGTSRIYHSILSLSGNNAASRLAVDGPVYNMHGGPAVRYDEFGEEIVTATEVWTGSTGIGGWATFSCGMWNSSSSGTTGRIGSAIEGNSNWINRGINRGCNLSARLYGLSPAFVAPLWGDYDGSHTVDGGDFLSWQRQLGQQPTATFAAARAFTSDLSQGVNVADLAVWREYNGQSLPASTTVPEPSACALALIALAARRRK